MQSDAPCFELENSLDLLRKAQHDFAQLDREVNSYDLFNFLCTVNHLADWAERERGLPRGFKHHVARLRKKLEIRTIAALCNRAKHFERRKDSPSPSTKVARVWSAGRYGKGPWGVGEPTYEVEVEGVMKDLLGFARSVLDEWEDVFKRHGLIPTSSQEHPAGPGSTSS